MTEKKQLFLAIVYTLLCAFVLALGSALVKVARSHIPLQFILFARFSVSLLYVILILFILRVRKKTVSLVPRYVGLHILRALATGSAIVLVYFTVHYISLYEVTLGNMTYPLFVPILLYLAKRSGILKDSMLGVLIGFLGAVFVLATNALNHMAFNLYLFLAVFSGVLAALSAIFAKKLVKHNHPYTIMFYYFLMATVATGCFISWPKLNVMQWMLLIGIGLVGALYQEFFIRALQFANVKIVTSLMYVSLIFSIVISWLFWQQVPSLFMWFGILMISAGSIITIRSQ